METQLTIGRVGTQKTYKMKQHLTIGNEALNKTHSKCENSSTRATDERGHRSCKIVKVLPMFLVPLIKLYDETIRVGRKRKTRKLL